MENKYPQNPNEKNLNIGILITALPTLAHGAVYYTENFPNPSMGNKSHNSVGWQFHSGTDATDRSLESTDFAVADGFTGGTRGFGAAAGPLTVGLAWTDEFADLDRSATEITSLYFVSNNADAATTMRFAIRLDTTWYVSSQTFTNPDGGTYSNFTTNSIEAPYQQSFTFSTDAEDWHLLAFNPGGTLNRDSFLLETDLPDGDLTAAGILFEGSTGTIRYDNFTINYVPEPSSLMLGALGALVAFRRRR